eukprot:TRINITY_DN5895_c1_g1_i3.p1 TRINITY_DN5895_c1_g1~~TRINITY_DN5895_c1_g1_i3.p1  ORF type:complete len:277 (+),score=73.55 TRINITY_DN5895_c1_g1_i3:58-888(+)
MGNCAAGEGKPPKSDAAQKAVPVRITRVSSSQRSTLLRRQRETVMKCVFEAVEKGDLETLRNMCETPRVYPKTMTKDGYSLLHVAAATGHVELVRYLLEYGFEPETRNGAGFTALHVAARYGHTGVVDELGCSRPSLLLTRCDMLTTPLHQAVFGSQTAMLQHLIGEGVSVNTMDHRRSSPLHYAATQGLETECLLLLAAGADYLQKDSQGHTPVDLALAEGHACIVGLFAREEETRRCVHTSTVVLRKVDTRKESSQTRFDDDVCCYDACSSSFD